jgi:hypothetical protein
MRPFAEDIIPKLIDIYNRNPSVETAKLLAIIGVPSKPLAEVLKPVPNPSLKQTDEEKAILKPLIDLLENMEKKYEKFLKQMFVNRFKRVIQDNPELKTFELTPFKVKIKTVAGTIKEVKTHIYESIKILKERVSVAFEIPVDNFKLIYRRFGEMDNERIVSDYNLQEGSTIDLILNAASGVFGKPRIIYL